MDYDNLILRSIKVSEVDEWCDLNPSRNYDESNRDEGERELFYKMISDALVRKTETVDNLTEVVLHLSHRIKYLEAHVEQITGQA
jgi:hypothetical protein